MQAPRPTVKRKIEPKATVDYLTPADSDVDDSTAEIMGDESVLRKSTQHFLRNKKRIHRRMREGKAPGVQIGSALPRASGKPKCEDKVACSCGVVHKRGSPAHEAHTKHYPHLCKKQAKRYNRNGS